MGLAARGQDAVARHGQAARLQPFLQFGLGVLGPAADFRAGDDLAEQALHQRLRGIEAGIEEDRADQRLQRIGQDGGALRATAARLALGQAHHLGQAELQRHAVQAVLAHQVRAHARQVAFVGAGEALEQQAGNGQAQHRIAEEFQAFVVVGAEAAVRQRPGEQLRLAEAVADAGLEFVESLVHRVNCPRAAVTVPGRPRRATSSSAPRT